MNKITYSEVARRKDILTTEQDSYVADRARLFSDRAEATGTLSNIRDLMQECAKDPKTASQYFTELQEYAVKHSDDKQITTVFENQILPIVSDVHPKNLTQYSILRWNSICDRIAENMDLVNGKIPVDSLIAERHINTATPVVDLCCEALNRFKKLGTVAKAGIALEESVMLLQKHEIPYTEASVARRVIDNVILMDDLTESSEELKDIIAAFNESTVMESPCNEKEFSHISVVEEFYGGERTAEQLDNIMNYCLCAPKTAKKVHLGAFTDVASVVAKSGNSNLVDAVFGTMESLADRFMKQFGNSVHCETVLHNLEGDIRAGISEAFIYGHMVPGNKGESKDSIDQVHIRYESCLRDVLQELALLEDYIYPTYNAKLIESASERSSGAVRFSDAMDKLSQIGNNILKSRKWIKGKAHVKSVGKDTTTTLITGGSHPKFLKMFNKERTPELENVHECLTPEGRIDYVVEQFEVVNGRVDAEVHSYMEQLCKEINTSVLFTESTGNYCYYIATENTVDIHYLDSTSVELNESEYEELVNHSISDSDVRSVYEMMQFAVLSEDIQIEAAEIEDFIVAHEEELFTQQDALSSFMELASIATIDEDLMKAGLTESLQYLSPINQSTLGYMIETYAPVESTPEIMIESLDLFCDLIHEKVDYNEKYKDVMDDDDEEDDKTKRDDKKDKKNPADDKGKKKSSGDGKDKKKKDGKEKEEKTLSFNNIKLYLMGAKKKVKDLSSKEQGLCRNMDASFNRFVKSMRSALVSDRREAIIKGSVIPSFSKSIKIGIALAGTAVINPLAPIIGGIGMFAASKYLTKKERALLLDDIEIELKILEKEISLAESRDETKKMRVLMKEQRNLQRQYQRIKYNIRVGKDIIPGGTED